MIRSIMVTNYIGDKLELDFAEPEKSGLAVIFVSGLGPGTATVNVSEIPTGDGALYNSARRSSRNIVLGLVFLWKESLVSNKNRIVGNIEDARLLTYKYFPLKKKIKLRIKTDTRHAEIEGYVESNEPSIFSKLEGTTISIICPDPNFYSVEGGGVQTTIFSSVEPAFEFPFKNDSLEENCLVFGVISQRPEKHIFYRGDVETGFTITITSMGNASGIAIYDMITGQRMELDSAKLESFTGSDIISGDKIIICTVRGKKSVMLERGGITINILNCLTRDSDWLVLRKGDNIFSYSADSGANNLRLRIDNQIIYEGV